MSEQPKLSELIRKGAALVDGRQCTEDYMRYNEAGQVCLCALGAAYYGLTGNLPAHDIKNELSVWDTLKEFVGGEDRLLRIVAVENDTSDMTFEEIAAELEGEGL